MAIKRSGMESDILFIYFMPHPSHRGFADSVGADFRHYNHYLKNKNYSKLFKSALNGALLPRYSVYLTEGGAPLGPVAVKKIFDKKVKNINIISDETFMMMKYTPKEMDVYYSRYINFAHRLVSKYIDGAIATSKFAKEIAEEFIDVPVRVAYPYIEDDVYRRLSEVHPNIEGHNIVSVGHSINSNNRKGMDILVEAYKIVKDQVDDAELYIIGRGHPREWNEIDGVHVEGFVEDLAPYFEISSLFVQSSRVLDTFSVATAEGLWAGLPSIVSENVGAKEVVQELDTNFIRKADPQDLAEAILYYFDRSDSKKRALSAKSKQISGKFNRKEMCELFHREFNLLLEEIKN